MRVESLIIVEDIQSLKAKEFDYAIFVAGQLETGLVAIQRDPSRIHFPHYSLLTHMVLFYGQELGLWPEEMKIRQCDNDEKPHPVQLWTSIWDCKFVRSSYIHFE